MQQNDLIVIVDRVEDETHNGKTRKRIITYAGQEYTIGLNLKEQWPILAHGVCLRLIMGVYQGNQYVDQMERCVDLTDEKRKELMQPAPKNPKDASIERQVAVKCVVDLICAGREVPDDLRKATEEWLRSALK